VTLTAAPELTATIQVGRDPARAARARRKVRALVAGSESPEHADLAELVVGELVANALRHGAGPVQVRLCRAPGGLRVEVHDEGAGRPVRRHAADYDECGRGLELLDALIAPLGGAWGTIDDDRGPGKTVYAVLPPARLATGTAARP
jgi:serine/threonine-protein kinase RsbW